MPDVLLVSSVFGTVKIAEPMGACILAAAVRERGPTVEILEPSVDGWSVEESVRRVLDVDAAVLGVSILRDRNVADVLRFVTAVRQARPELFIVVGGHGPSLGLGTLPSPTPVAALLAAQPPAAGPEPAGPPDLIQLGVRGPVVDPSLTDRGKGAADLSGGTRKSTYYDLTPDYLAILAQADACLVGESDLTFPDLVERVLTGQPWDTVPGLARVADGVFRRNPPPAKVPDLDALPFMARDVLARYRDLYGRDVPASILASRGCFYRCTFCSVVSYERLQSGRNHRQRSNANLVEEIVRVHREHGVTAFNFEDDNFIVRNAAGVAKIHDLCDRLLALDFPVRFTFFCRADVVDEELFRHLKAAGLVGLYFGLESVYEGDLEFFHKGLSLRQMYEALDILRRVGYSPAVDAQLRLMLGYITWHPLSSFASLRASAEFVRSWAAPPKLLRRKLRVYAGTEVVDDVRRMGLLDGDHPDGWRYADARIDGLERVVNDLFARTNRHRDALRTLEKAAGTHGFDLDVSAYTTHRRYLDRFLCDAFDRILDAAETTEGVAASSPEVSTVLAESYGTLDDYLRGHAVTERIADGYRHCGFDTGAVDLFRK
jgi:Radical SAM superfamily/B12 binding domain